MRLEPVRQEARSIHTSLSLTVGSPLSVVPTDPRRKLCAGRKKIETYPRGRWMKGPACSNLGLLEQSVSHFGVVGSIDSSVQIENTALYSTCVTGAWDAFPLPSCICDR